LSLIFPRKLTQQPLGTAQVDWGNPLCAGMLSTTLLAGPTSWVSSKKGNFRVTPPAVNGGGAVVNKYGPAFFISQYGGCDVNLSLTDPSYLATGDVCSFVFAGQLGGVGSTYSVLTTSASSGGVCIDLSSGTIRLLKEGVAVIGQVSGAMAAGETAIFAVTYDGNTAKFYKTGTYIGGGSSAQTFTHLKAIIGLGYGGGSQFYGSLNIVSAWNRVLSPSEAISLSANPWQVFRDSSPRLFAVSAAGGGLTITGTLGTADASAFLANVDLQRTIAAVIGSASASGFTATVNLQLNVSATLGSASAAGFTANVNLARTIAAVLGTAAASGYDATVTLAGALIIPASLGVATATGLTANVNLTYALSASLGTAVATGFDATIDNTSAPFTPAELAYLLAYMEANLMIPTAADIAAAVLAAMNTTPPAVNIKQVNDRPITGQGVPGNSMRPS
jgi:hypothetical protein